jgi:D-3-phosphoglycerate dehydrogenase
VAKERGIVVSEVKHDRRGPLQTQIRLTVQTEVQGRTIAGTIFNGDQPRIVEITDIPMDARLGPNMLFVSNNDKPGLIGGLGTILGNAGINIATFNLGRDHPGGNAIALIEIDEAPPEAVLDQIKALPNVVRVCSLQF